MIYDIMNTRVLYSIHGVPGTVPGTGYGYSTGYPVLGSSERPTRYSYPGRTIGSFPFLEGPEAG
jgi:hypothetical protein